MKNTHPPMRSVWHSLLWKEWHEHKWKLAALIPIMVTITPLAVLQNTEFRTLWSAIITTQVIYCVIVGTFLGMSVAGGESGRKTLPFLQSLPTPTWQSALAKLFVALLTATLPLVVLLVAYNVFWNFDWSRLAFHEWKLANASHPWGISNLMLAATVGGILAVGSLVLWMSAAGLNRSDEISAGAIGFLVICLIWLLYAFCADQAEKYRLQFAVGGIEYIFAAMPAGPGLVGVVKKFRGDEEWLSRFLPILVTMIVAHGCVLTWYLCRFGRVVPKPARNDFDNRSSESVQNVQLAPPLSSQFSAIAWKQLRETGPLALLAAGVVLVISTAAWLYDRPAIISIESLGAILAGVSLSVCFFVTIVAGIGVFLEDLKPRVEDYWRSKPINYPLWFGLKFVVGFLVLAATFGTLMVLAYLLTEGSILRQERQPLLIVGLFAMIFLLMYTLSMSTYCMLRQPLYAAVLALGLFIGGIFVVNWIDYYFTEGPTHWSVLLILMLISQVAATALAWLAAKRDWRLLG